MPDFLDDLTIARNTVLESIEEIAESLTLPASALYRYGPYKGKVDLDYLASLPEKESKLILVTAISPTPAGEGKTTTTIGLGDALHALGQKTMICLREPSLGPCFGIKGGATGGGKAQVAPMDEINLHFTGDFHAITTAHNLLAALIDNHIYWGNTLGIDPTKITWRRVMDMNDRALRQIVVGLGQNGQPREDGFDITVASEVMAIFCLSKNLQELEDRLGSIVVGQTFDKRPVTARALQAAPAMTALLADAFRPNLVQTLEHTPTFIHGGPFANIAHGCNSLVATNAALKLADYVVTEAGFGADLGAEKFFDIKCRQGNLTPSAVVLVATIRALKMHGGATKDKLGAENPEAVAKGLPNLLRHIENLQKFGLPVVVALNAFTSDTEMENAIVEEACHVRGVPMILCRHWAEGSKGAENLAMAILALTQEKARAFTKLYEDDLPLLEKIEKIAKEIYRAKEVAFAPAALKKLENMARDGYDKLPVCMAKTPVSFSADAALLGAPDNHVVPVRDVRLSAGAGFVVALCGDIMTMPGLPKEPAAHRIHLNAAGKIEGLF